MTDIRDVYLAACAASLELLQEPAVSLRWRDGSVLAEFTVGDLAGHLARSTLQVEMFLDAEEPDEAPITAVEYYAGLQGVRDLGSELNVGVRARGAEMAAMGAKGLADAVATTLTRLQQRLRREPDTRQLTAFGRTLRLDEYLRTRLIELTVHIDDLALSVGVEAPQVQSEAYASAIATLVDVGRSKYGDLEVLHALTRRERDVDDALHIL
jgi:Mycothiol maleylpyruvate isomerase N-terminal domain